MATTRLHRFDFSSLRDFRGPIVMQSAVQEVVIEEVIPPPPPAITSEELEAAKSAGRKQGYQEGYQAGSNEAKKTFDAKTEQSNHIIAQLSEHLHELQERYKAMLKSESAMLTQLCLTIAKKVAGEALEKRSEHEIAAMLERCLPVLLSKPRLMIDLHPDAMDSAISRIEKQLVQAGYDGEVQFRANESLAKSDVLLDWGSGQAARNSAHLWNEIDTLITRVPLEITFAETQNNSTGENHG